MWGPQFAQSCHPTVSALFSLEQTKVGHQRKPLCCVHLPDPCSRGHQRVTFGGRQNTGLGVRVGFKLASCKGGCFCKMG